MNAFSAFVSTLKEDLQAIQGDLNEFVTTVREDASAVLGVDLSAPPPNTGRFEDLLRERPELLCERTRFFLILLRKGCKLTCYAQRFQAAPRWTRTSLRRRVCNGGSAVASSRIRNHRRN